MYRNEALFWTYGYEVFKNEELMYKGRCGQVWVFGCGFLNMNVGDVHQFDFEVKVDRVGATFPAAYCGRQAFRFQ